MPYDVLREQTSHAVVNSTGSSSNLTDLMQQAVNAIGSYRMDLQNQLPAPVSSLTQLKGVNNLDTALTAQVCCALLDTTQPLIGTDFDLGRDWFTVWSCLI